MLSMITDLLPATGLKPDDNMLKGLGFCVLISMLRDSGMFREAKVCTASYMLATVRHETAATYLPIKEYGKDEYFKKYEPSTSIGKALGNTEEGDGLLYKGRGYVQITGRRNYRVMSSKLGVSLVERPDVALDPVYAFEIMRIGMTEGLFTGKRIGTYTEGESTDYRNARRVINGTDRAELIAGYAKEFEDSIRDLKAKLLPRGIFGNQSGVRQ